MTGAGFGSDGIGQIGVTGLSMLMDAAIKGLVVFVLAAVVARGLRRASAAARHLVWFAAMASLFLLPVFSAVLGLAMLWAAGDAPEGQSPTVTQTGASAKPAESNSPAASPNQPPWEPLDQRGIRHAEAVVEVGQYRAHRHTRQVLAF